MAEEKKAPPPPEEPEEDAPEEGAPAWMATFADLATLLLTFFVLLLSFANLNVIEFKTALGSVKNALGVITRKPGYFEGRTTNPIEWEAEDGPNKPQKGIPDHIVPIQALIQRRQLEGAMKLIVTEDHIILRVHKLFKSGSADLDPERFDELDIITQLVKVHPHPVVIEAHTDDRPIATDRYPSNWELSAARSGAVARYLVSGGQVRPKRISPSGFAHYRPVASNATAKGRAENRRLDVVLARKDDTAAQLNDSSGW
ncbi:MAG: OmpA family protein [Myxococcota bacterium]